MKPITDTTSLVGGQSGDVQIGCCSVSTLKTCLVSYSPALISICTGMFGMLRHCDDGRAGTIILTVCSVAFGALSMLSSCCLCCTDNESRYYNSVGFVAGATGLALGIKDAVFVGNC